MIEPLPGFLRSNARWLLAGFLLTFASSFGQTFYISIYAADIRAAFSLSDGQWGGIYSLATMGSAAVMVLAGGLTDRFRVRLIGVAVILGLAVAALLMARITEVWLLLLAIFLLRLMGQGMMGQTAMVAMGRWFVASRGRAVSVASLGVALGEAALPIAFVALMAVFDWRLLWVIAAMILLAIAPVLWALLRKERTPQSFVEEAGSVGMEGRAWSRGQVARHWLFWLLLPMMLGPAAWNTAFFFHQVHFAAAKGWTHFELVQLFPLYTATSVVFLLISGAAVDRFGSAFVGAIYLLPAAAGYFVLGVAGTPLAAAAGVMLVGACAGAHSTMSVTLWAEYFGTRHLGKIRAMTTAIMVLGTAIGPSVTGVLIDFGVDFPRQSFGIAAFYVVAAGLTAIGVFRARRLLQAV